MMAVVTVALFKSQLYGLFGGLLGVRSIPTLPKYCKAHFGENGHDVGHTRGEGLWLKFIKHFQIFHSLLSTQREKKSNVCICSLLFQNTWKKVTPFFFANFWSFLVSPWSNRTHCWLDLCATEIESNHITFMLVYSKS